MPIPTTPASTPRSLLRDQVYERLAEAIVEGQLAPGQVLSDVELSSWLGASRTPIREALNRLAKTGLVRILPQKATMVAPVDPNQFAEIMEVLGALYTAVVNEAVPLLTDGDVTVLRGFEKRVLAQNSRASEATAISTPGEIFHIFLARYGNRVLLQVPDKFTPHVQRTLNIYRTAVDARAGFPQLRAVIDAAADRDAARAARAVREYFATAVLDFTTALAVMTPNDAANTDKVVR